MIKTAILFKCLLTLILCEVFRSGIKPSFGLRPKKNKHTTNIKFINQAENHRKEIVMSRLFNTNYYEKKNVPNT